VTCNKAFVSSRDKQRFCSDECRLVGHSKERLVRYYAARPDTKTIICSWCQEEYVGPFGSTPYNKMHDKCAVQAKQARYRIKTVKRQSKIVSRTVMTVAKLVERDGADCFICGENVDLTLARTNRFGATVDHVVPLKRGGLDTPDNLRLAHWICNVRKGSKLMEEMNG
jgi:5-methylcytosine-specific restriction endonuclease McrA